MASFTTRSLFQKPARDPQGLLNKEALKAAIYAAIYKEAPKALSRSMRASSQPLPILRDTGCACSPG